MFQFGTSFFFDGTYYPNRPLDYYAQTDFFLSSVFPFFGYNGTPLRPQNVERHLLKNKSCYHHNANGRFGIIHFCRQVVYCKLTFLLFVLLFLVTMALQATFDLLKPFLPNDIFFCEIVFLQLSFIFLLHRFA